MQRRNENNNTSFTNYVNGLINNVTQNPYANMVFNLVRSTIGTIDFSSTNSRIVVILSAIFFLYLFSFITRFTTIGLVALLIFYITIYAAQLIRRNGNGQTHSGGDGFGR